MTSLQVEIALTDYQKRRLISAINNNKSISLRFKHSQLHNKGITGGSITDILPESVKNIVNNVLEAIKKRTGYGFNTTSSQMKSLKSGGFLPLLFPALAALGGLATGASAITRAVMSKKEADKQLAEQKRHNEMIEAAALSKKGSGLFKKCTKCNGKGLYLYKKPTGSGLFLGKRP